jgi:hypothetical protein
MMKARTVSVHFHHATKLGGAYNLAFAVTLLTGAALGDRYGRKRMYWIGLLGFTIASTGAALSRDVGALIAARGVQGIAAAVVMPMTLTLISDAFLVEKRGAAIGLWGGIELSEHLHRPVPERRVAGGGVLGDRHHRRSRPAGPQDPPARATLRCAQPRRHPCHGPDTRPDTMTAHFWARPVSVRVRQQLRG